MTDQLQTGTIARLNRDVGFGYVRDAAREHSFIFLIGRALTWAQAATPSTTACGSARCSPCFSSPQDGSPWGEIQCISRTMPRCDFHPRPSMDDQGGQAQQDGDGRLVTAGGVQVRVAHPFWGGARAKPDANAITHRPFKRGT